MKKVSYFLIASVSVFAIMVIHSCDEGNGNGTEPIVEGILVKDNITKNTTWTTGNVYVLDSRITVLDGVTLTIEPGVVIKGKAGTGVNATALLIARGGKLMAEGTASEPIIFTSIADEIKPGEVASPNLEPELNGLWGGVIVLGKAPISADEASVQIEGIPASDQNGLYGGEVADDNSGVIKYVSIRHGGANIGEGNEINGLTLGGVGSGTVIENIEIVANQDDGIEWFGGSVSLKNVVVWNTGDDAIDTDQAWAGTLDNFIIIAPGDECFELDGGEGTFNAMHTIKNGSVLATTYNADGEVVRESEGLADLDYAKDEVTGEHIDDDPSNSDVSMSNIFFMGLTIGQDFDDNPPTLTLANIEATLPSDTLALGDFFKKGTDEFVSKVTTNSVGADVSKFQEWSWAAVSGALANF